MVVKKRDQITKAIIAFLIVVAILGCIVLPQTIKAVRALEYRQAVTVDIARPFVGYGDENTDYHEATKLPGYSDDAPSITFMIAGQGGDASYWSNDGARNFTYDETSMIEVLRSYSGANVYWANPNMPDTPTYQDGEFTLKLINKDLGYQDPLVPELDDKGNQVVIEEKPQFVPDPKNYITRITDVTKHAIVVFEPHADDVNNLHRVVYEQMHTVIDMISYDYLVLTGRIPKVNLIGHSRGGLINMMYAAGYAEDSFIANREYRPDGDNKPWVTDEEGEADVNPDYTSSETEIIHGHPFNVDSLFGMGTPYQGTALNKPFAHKILHNVYVNISVQYLVNCRTAFGGVAVDYTPFQHGVFVLCIADRRKCVPSDKP